MASPNKEDEDLFGNFGKKIVYAEGSNFIFLKFGCEIKQYLSIQNQLQNPEQPKQKRQIWEFLAVDSFSPEA